MAPRVDGSRLFDLGVIVLVLYLLSKTLLITYQRAKDHIWYRWVLLVIGLLYLLLLL